ncbi:MAG: hypothetical protein HKN31_04930 [Pricia sp.]|nr:hypothetical protein [Pricia sp.]
MKIRIKGNSIRIRITKSEVSHFCNVGFVEEKTNFNTAVFTYAISKEEGLESFVATFLENTITFKLPEKMVMNWDTNEKVGFQSEMTLHNGEKLSLLLEKDFTCLENREEDQSDNYPNPKLIE